MRIRLLVPLMLLASCATMDSTRVAGPQRDRCAHQPEAHHRKSCEELRELAYKFARGLSVDDQVCLEGNPISDGVTSRCRVRASVSDVARGSVKFEIRDAPHDSKYRPMDSYWFHEAAIADMYLEGQGY